MSIEQNGEVIHKTVTNNAPVQFNDVTIFSIDDIKKENQIQVRNLKINIESESSGKKTGFHSVKEFSNSKLIENDSNLERNFQTHRVR